MPNDKEPEEGLSNQQRNPDDIERPPLLLKEDGSTSFPFAILLVGILLAARGRWFLGVSLAVVGLTFATCQAAMEQIQDEDKQDIRYNILNATDILRELMDWETTLSCQELPNTTPPGNVHQRQKCRVHCIAGLEALAKKYARQQQQQHESKRKQKRPQKESPQMTINHELELICQQAAYIAYRLFPTDDDQVLAAALSLHALVAKDPQVRQCHLFQADIFGLNIPVQCMRDALQRAKAETNDDRQQQMAELQRKACLLLGALGDGDADVATRIVEEDGLQAVLETANWFRYHEDVANWALWAVFILSYENPPNKVRNVQLGGVPIIIQAVKNVPDCLEVARHGVAILFDLMRDVGDATEGHHQLDVWAIRKAALAAGLHQVILQAMTRFSNSVDIIMMGQDILAGTDYKGQVPQYQPGSGNVVQS
jgi:hypothetical protein